ncbi:unnamed protein product [Aspergillus oryzae var. brunneus]|uniref:Unnamed protein product n=2 Tax=Aspergillus oryzae TaxID=5062 RepID=A0AAN4YWF5_ASPOZ|nr:unnamed protein product [Aspergillus oryzae]GMG09262.1 unnamed protein product [Aspergillus oryzae]GMG34737.1 unnamed protein product [Aspergillus oryzae]GMG53245.1 unnamed protein product [Aspergillus oryzae var. brunneus]
MSRVILLVIDCFKKLSAISETTDAQNQVETFLDMKKIEDQAIKAVLRVYSIHIRRQSTLLIASHPARQETCTSWRRYARTYLETTTTATTLATSRVGGSGGDVLDTADSHAGTGKSTEGGLSTGTGGLGTVTYRALANW